MGALNKAAIWGALLIACLLLLALTVSRDACAYDSLEMHSGSHASRWTGDLLTLRWGTHQIEFDAQTQDNWTDEAGIFDGGMDDLYDPWSIDVQYNHVIRHIPMMCTVRLTQRPGQYDVWVRCHA